MHHKLWCISLICISQSKISRNHYLAIKLFKNHPDFSRHNLIHLLSNDFLFINTLMSEIITNFQVFISKIVSMNNKYFIRIINEEINNFDFLNNEESLKEQENIDLLMNEDLQKQFICDSLLNRNDKIKIIEVLDARMGENWDSPNIDDADKLTIEYNISLEYIYDTTKNPLLFDMSFNGNNVGINIAGSTDKGDYMTQPSNESWINYINWYEISVRVLDKDGGEVEFLAYDNAPQKIQNLFIREYLEEFISNHTKMEVREKTDDASITQYC